MKFEDFASTTIQKSKVRRERERETLIFLCCWWYEKKKKRTTPRILQTLLEVLHLGRQSWGTWFGSREHRKSNDRIPKMGGRDYFHIECWMQVGCIYKCPWVWDLKKKKEGTEAVYQDSGVYHHAVSYCDIGHISADFRNDAYDFMARDKLDVKCWDIPPSSIRRISLEKRRKNSQETWLGTRPKKKNKKIPNQSFFSSSFSPRKLHKPTSATWWSVPQTPV